MNHFKDWEDCTVKEQLQVTYSDMFKDVNGFRPCNHDMDMTETELEEALDDLQNEMELQIVEQKVREELGIKKFNNLMTEIVEMCNTDLTGAMRFIIQGEGDDWYDWGYYCHNNNLPYTYEPEGVDFESLGEWYHLWGRVV